MRLIDIEQGSQEWLDLRKNKITSTDMSVILNKSPWKEPYVLWEEKTGLREPRFHMNDAMKRGVEYEPEARNKVNETLLKSFIPKVILSDNDYLMASLDGLCDDTIIEIKTPLPENFEKARYGEIPEYYNIQMQSVFAASDGKIDKGFYCVYSPEYQSIIILDVKPNNKLIDQILIEGKDFHRRIREFDAPIPKHQPITNEFFRKAAEKYRKSKELIAEILKSQKEAEEEMKRIAGENSVEGYGVKLTHYHKRGGVDYSSIPELKDVNLEKYRKPTKSFIRISA